jgi:hypothetical protein
MRAYSGLPAINGVLFTNARTATSSKVGLSSLGLATAVRRPKGRKGGLSALILQARSQQPTRKR